MLIPSDCLDNIQFISFDLLAHVVIYGHFLAPKLCHKEYNLVYLLKCYYSFMGSLKLGKMVIESRAVFLRKLLLLL